jgi:hypothetical protein
MYWGGRIKSITDSIIGVMYLGGRIKSIIDSITGGMYWA